MAISEVELTKLLSSAVSSSSKAEQGDATEQARAIDALKVLSKAVVTSELLLKTDAGKTVKKLSKHTVASIKAAAGSCMDAWKNCVRQEQSKKAETKQQPDADAAEPSSSQPPDAAAASTTPSGVERQDSLGSAPSFSKLKGRPARSGDSMRDKIRDLLAEALAAACSDEVPAECDPCKVAVEVEEAMMRQNGGVNAKYKAKYRSVRRAFQFCLPF